VDEKKPIILIGTPHYKGFSHQYVLSAFSSVYELYPKYHIALGTAEGGQIHINRNVIFKTAYDEKVDYLLYIDTDMMWLPEHIEEMVKFDKDVVGGLCTTRKRPQKYCVYESDGKGRCHPITEAPKVPFKCFAIGSGFLLLKRSVITRMWEHKAKYGYPFDPVPHGLLSSKSNIESDFLGEDISFSARLRKAGFDIWCHPNVKPGHVGEIVMGVAEDKDEQCDN